MKRLLIRLLLRVLNSSVLNPTPCPYGHINNLDAFSAEYLASEERQRPGITVATVLAESRLFRQCGAQNGLAVIEGQEVREGTIWDVHELRQQMARRPMSIDVRGQTYWGCRLCFEQRGHDDPRIPMFATWEEAGRHIKFHHE